MAPGTVPLAALAARDPEALRRLAEENTARLYRAARGMGLSADEAEDAVQDVFVTFLSTLDRFEGRSAVSTWLYGILLRKAQERRRARARDQRHEALDDDWQANFNADGTWARRPAAPDRQFTSRQMSRSVAECLDDLSPQQRQVFVLRLVEELTGAEAGNILGLTVTHIGVLLHRARARMRVCLEGLGWNTTEA